MFRYISTRISIKSINILLMSVFSFSFLLSSCGTKVIDKRYKGPAIVEDNGGNSPDSGTPTSPTDKDPNNPQDTPYTVECNRTIYGDECNNLENFMLVKKDELVATSILKDKTIGGVEGSFLGQGYYSDCSEDGMGG